MTGTPTERFNPYSREGVPRRLVNETPSQIVKLLTQQPPTDSKFKEPSQSAETRSDGTEYVMERPERRSPVRLSKASVRFKSYNPSILEDQRHIHMFRKRDRHHELADDALSVITHLTTDKYSRFDRLFGTIEEPFQDKIPLLPSLPQDTLDQSAKIITDNVNIEQSSPISEQETGPSRQQQHMQERDTPMDIDSSFFEVGDDSNDAPIENTQRSLFHDIRLATQETGHEHTQKSLFHEITLATQEIPERKEVSSPRLQAQTQTQTQTQTNTQTQQELPIQPSSARSRSVPPPPSAPPLPTAPVIETQHDTFESEIRRAQEGMDDDNDYYGGGFEDNYDDHELDQENNDIEGDFSRGGGDADMGFNRFANEQPTSRSKDAAVFDADDNSLPAPISSTDIRKPVEPRYKVVVQGDSFISNLMDKPPSSGFNVMPTKQVKTLFDAFLSFDKYVSIPVGRYAQMRSLFFAQMMDDLKRYKENQPENLQNEITPEDMILLMKRQKIITDKQSLEAVAHKYLPKEYSDLVSQSALAYNRLYPAAMRGNSDDSFDDDEHNYDDE